MKLKWKLCLLILGLSATLSQCKSFEVKPPEPDSEIQDVVPVLERHKRFIGSFFSIDGMLSKMTNIMGFFGMDTSGMFQLQTLYNSAFSQNHLLFKRKILNLIMRTCHFILGYLPEEPVQQSAWFTKDYRLSYQTQKNEPGEPINELENSVNLADNDLENDSESILEIVTQKNLNSESDAITEINSESEKNGTSDNSEPKEGNYIRKKRDVKNVVSEILENALLEAQNLKDEIQNSRNKRSLHLNVNWQSRYYNQDRTTTTTTNSPIVIEKNIRFNWGVNTNVRKQHRTQVGEYHEEDYIDDDVFLRKREIDSEFTTGTGEFVETTTDNSEYDPKSEITKKTNEENSLIGTTTENDGETTTEFVITTEDLELTETEKDLESTTDNSPVTQSISIEEITTQFTPEPKSDGELSGEFSKDKIMVQMGKSYFPAEIILTHTTKPNKGIGNEEDVESAEDGEIAKEEDPAHQLLYLVDDDKSVETPQEIIVDNHVLNEVLDEMAKMSDTKSESTTESELTTEYRELATDKTSTVSDIETDTESVREEMGDITESANSESDMDAEFKELMERLQNLEQLVGIMSSVIESQKQDDGAKISESTTEKMDGELMENLITSQVYDVEPENNELGPNNKDGEMGEDGEFTNNSESVLIDNNFIPITTENGLMTTVISNNVKTTNFEYSDDGESTTTYSVTQQDEEEQYTGKNKNSESDLDLVFPTNEISTSGSPSTTTSTTTTTTTTTEQPPSLVFPEGYTPEEVEELTKNLMHHRHLKHLAEGKHLNHLILRLAKDVNINDVEEIMENIEHRLENHEKKLMVLIRKKKMDDFGLENGEVDSEIIQDELERLLLEVIEEHNTKGLARTDREKKIDGEFESIEGIGVQNENEERLTRQIMGPDGQNGESPVGEIVLPITLLKQQEEKELESGVREDRKHLFVSEVMSTEVPSLLRQSMNSKSGINNSTTGMKTKAQFPRRRRPVMNPGMKKPAGMPSLEISNQKLDEERMVEEQMTTETAVTKDRNFGEQTITEPSKMIENMQKFRKRMRMKNKLPIPNSESKLDLMSTTQLTTEKLEITTEVISESIPTQKTQNSESLNSVTSTSTSTSITPSTSTTVRPVMVMNHKLTFQKTQKINHMEKVEKVEKMKKNHKKEDDDDEDDDDDYGLDSIIDYFYHDDSDEDEEDSETKNHKNSKSKSNHNSKRNKRFLFDRFRNSLDNFRLATNNQHFQDAFSEYDGDREFYSENVPELMENVNNYRVYPSEYLAPYPAKIQIRSQNYGLPCDTQKEDESKESVGPWIKFDGFENLRKQTQNTFNPIRNQYQIGQVQYFNLPKINLDSEFFVGSNSPSSTISPIIVTTTTTNSPSIITSNNKNLVTEANSESAPESNIDLRKNTDDVDSFSLPGLDQQTKFKIIFQDKHVNDLNAINSPTKKHSSDVSEIVQELEFKLLPLYDRRVNFKTQFSNNVSNNVFTSNSDSFQTSVNSKTHSESNREITKVLENSLENNFWKLKNMGSFKVENFYDANKNSKSQNSQHQIQKNDKNKEYTENVIFSYKNDQQGLSVSSSYLVPTSEHSKLENSEVKNFNSKTYKPTVDLEDDDVRIIIRDEIDRSPNSETQNFDKNNNNNRNHTEITKVVESNLQSELGKLKNHGEFSPVTQTYQQGNSGINSEYFAPQLQNFKSGQFHSFKSQNLHSNSNSQNTYQEITNAVQNQLENQIQNLKKESEFNAGFGTNLAHREITLVVEKNLENQLQNLKPTGEFIQNYQTTQNKQNLVNFDAEKMKNYYEITYALQNQLENKLQNLKKESEFNSNFGPNLGHREITLVVEKNLENQLQNLKPTGEFNQHLHIQNFKTQNSQNNQNSQSLVNFDAEKMKNYYEITYALQNQLENKLQNLKKESEFNSNFGPNLGHREITLAVEKNLENQLQNLKTNGEFTTNFETQNFNTQNSQKTQNTQNLVNFDSEKMKTYQEITNAVQSQLENKLQNLQKESEFNSGFGPNLGHREITLVVEKNLENQLQNLKPTGEFTNNLKSQNSKTQNTQNTQTQETKSVVNFDVEKMKNYYEITYALQNQLENKLQNLKPTGEFRPIALSRVESTTTKAISDIYNKTPFLSSLYNPNAPKMVQTQNKNNLFVSTIYMPPLQPSPTKVTTTTTTTTTTTESPPKKITFELVPNSKVKITQNSKVTNSEINQKVLNFEDSIKNIVGFTNSVKGDEITTEKSIGELSELQKTDGESSVSLPSRFGFDDDLIQTVQQKFPPLIHKSINQINSLSGNNHSPSVNLISSSLGLNPINSMNVPSNSPVGRTQNFGFTTETPRFPGFNRGDADNDDDVLIFSRFSDGDDGVVDNKTNKTTAGLGETTPTTLAPPTTSIHTSFVTSTSVVTQKQKFKQFKAFKPQNNIVVNYIYKKLPKDAHPKGFFDEEDKESKEEEVENGENDRKQFPVIDVNKFNDQVVGNGPRRGDVIESIEDVDDDDDDDGEINGEQNGGDGEFDKSRRNENKEGIKNIFGVNDGDGDQQVILKTLNESGFGKKIKG